MHGLALNKIIYFEAVARHSRITTAATELFVTSSAVSQQIKQLEEALGVQLFRRIKRRLVLTEEGERLYKSANEALTILNSAHQQIARTKDSFKFILRVSASFGVIWLGPRIASFVAQNPLWDLHIDATPELTDFEKENVDLDVRYGHKYSSGLYCEPIIHDAVLPMCSPEYRPYINNKKGCVVTMLQECRLIHTVKSRISWDKWLKVNEIKDVDTRSGLRFDRSSMALQSAKNGAGIVLESATLAMEELRNQTLVPAFPELAILRFPAYWMICPANHVNRNVSKIFMNWLIQEASLHEQNKKQILAALTSLNFVDLSD